MSCGITKKCWSCEATTDYEIGWCDNCFERLKANKEYRQVYTVSLETEDAWLAGLLRKAIADALYFSAVRRKPQIEDLLEV